MLQTDRFTKIFIAIGHASAVFTFEMRLVDQDLVFLRLAEMKPLRDNIAKMFHERRVLAVWIMLYLLFSHFFPLSIFYAHPIPYFCPGSRNFSLFFTTLDYTPKPPNCQEIRFRVGTAHRIKSSKFKFEVPVKLQIPKFQKQKWNPADPSAALGMTFFWDTRCPDSIEGGCTILLLAIKIKKFISFPHKHLSIFAPKKIAHFRMRDASSCKGWGDAILSRPQFLVFNC